MMVLTTSHIELCCICAKFNVDLIIIPTQSDDERMDTNTSVVNKPQIAFDDAAIGIIELISLRLLAAYFTFVEISIAVERLMATFYVKTYENSHSSAMYLNIGIPWFVLIVTYLATYNVE
uniref:Uncharacterized protein n=1 Tax=Acrobeloides nanus TaxID=290746 RepID=A0A914EIE1_9BILA